MKTGVILSGGTGSRLMPLTKVINKHLLPVYNIPMIYAPIRTLKQLGCTDIVVVAGGEHIGGLAEVLGDGSDLDVSITYRVQREADGIAGAINCVSGLVQGTFPVILGDNYFADPPTVVEGPAIYIKRVENASAYGVYDAAENRIVEKPQVPISDWAVTGLYVFDQKVFDYIKRIEKSDRGEYEVTDINNIYLQDEMEVVKYEGWWRDMGVFEGLFSASEIERG
jgi:glucose-1-phosphate thymidylyltransferase